MMHTVFLVLTILLLTISSIWVFSTYFPCPSWLAWMVEIDNPFTNINRSNTIIEYLNPTPGMKILDAGCGPGRLTISLAQKVGAHGEVVALDLQQEMLNRVKAKAQAANLNNIRFLHAGIGEGKLECNYYDCITLVTVLGEIPDQQTALNELFNALKPGGILSITELIFDPHFQRKSKVLALAQAVGFKEKAFSGNRFAYTVHLQKPFNHS